MVSKQAEEWQLQSELREQMQGYKRMRHQHKHQASVLEGVCCQSIAGGHGQSIAGGCGQNIVGGCGQNIVEGCDKRALMADKILFCP